MAREQLTGLVLARNEAQDLPDCLALLQEACVRTVVVDDRSTDETPNIARWHGCKVVETDEASWGNFSAMRNLGLAAVDTQMVFVLDADERPDREVLAAVGTVDLSQAGRILRRNKAFGGWLDHGRFQNDWQVRVMPAETRYAGIVHERPELPLGTEVVNLPGTVEHLTYASIREYIAKMRLYAAKAAEQGEYPGGRQLLDGPYNYLRLQGYRDGWRGAAMGIGDSWYQLMIRRHAARLASETDKAGLILADVVNTTK